MQLLLLTLYLLRTHAVHQDCMLYLAPSLLSGAGRGVISGISMDPNSYLQQPSSSLIIHLDDVRGTQLMNYVWGANEDNYTILGLGISSLFNHDHHQANVKQYWSTAFIQRHDELLRYSYTNLPPLTHLSTQHIPAYSELTIDYGTDDWFAARGIPLSQMTTNATLYDPGTLRSVGSCLSGVYVSSSTILGAGRGLFANRKFLKGDVITISPALSLSEQHIINSSARNLLMNYCFQLPLYDKVFLPIAWIGLINHSRDRPNAVITMDFDKKFLLEEVLHNNFSSVNFKAIALDDIEINDEILINYGVDWDEAFRSYQIFYSAWNAFHCVVSSNDSLQCEDSFESNTCITDFNVEWMVDNYPTTFREFIRFHNNYFDTNN